MAVSAKASAFGSSTPAIAKPIACRSSIVFDDSLSVRSTLSRHDWNAASGDPKSSVRIWFRQINLSPRNKPNLMVVPPRSIPSTHVPPPESSPLLWFDSLVDAKFIGDDQNSKWTACEDCEWQRSILRRSSV
ncbi:hypothetical protein RB3552 [Rhodopirellula baltica SH 1]|uniref:Uncharacterized protein n=1 Tax=Rhodopirellula baltica (strain DSM 10527 / NCIMB 13988 / SH1) TaxID=243090 RepID=Q7UU27_RHOBA|nr:hypothetical protein RB3552 [Rhodopirellula baltica SH 1]